MSSSGSEMSEWASEDDAPLQRPVFKSKTEEANWERKQRNREYRVASRREKRNRKADEKKQRKLNATILRRMTKNPEKYNKNLDRNRRRDVEMERRNIYKEAVAQAERLAAIYDPSGRMFNVGPVITQDDGKVVSVEALERRAKLQAERAARLAYVEEETRLVVDSHDQKVGGAETHHNGINPARQQLIKTTTGGAQKGKQLSKNQQRKLALYEPQPPPPKPVIPQGIKLAEGETDWLCLWDLPDEELERRVVKEKKRKAAERKALRDKQQMGKSERRAARDERRRVYREKKLEWKAIKETEKVQKRKLLRLEQEEAKRIEVEVNVAERRRAMEICATLGFTLDNVEGVSDIKPRLLGMRGQEVDFDVLEIGEKPSGLKVKKIKTATAPKSKAKTGNRIDLGKVVDESKVTLFGSRNAAPADMEGDFISLEGIGDIHGYPAQEQGELNYNHRLRRKIHRAMEAAQIKKELLVRATTKQYCESNGIEVPAELAVEYQPIKLSGRRTLEDGTVETAKQERVRKRLELAEYNRAAKVLRAQAKAEAIEAGLRVFAALTGKKQTGDNIEPVEGGATELADERRADSGIPAMPQSSIKRKRDNGDSEFRTSKKSKISNTEAIIDEGLGNTELEPQKSKTSREVKVEETAEVPIEDVDVNSATKVPGDKIKRPKAAKGSGLEDDAARMERKRLRKERKKLETLNQKTAEMDQENSPAGIPASKRHKKGENVDIFAEILPTNGLKAQSEGKSSVNGKVNGIREVPINSAEQWNPEALKGDSARKDKFLRLLGAGKHHAGELPVKRSKSFSQVANIMKVEEELERQFDSGVRKKHDSQGKRKGLGA